MISPHDLLSRAETHRKNPNAHGATTASVLERAALDIGHYHNTKEAIEVKLAALAKPSIGDAPFGMDSEEAHYYLAGKRAALQWVLEILP